MDDLLSFPETDNADLIKQQFKQLLNAIEAERNLSFMVEHGKFHYTNEVKGIIQLNKFIDKYFKNLPENWKELVEAINV